MLLQVNDLKTYFYTRAGPVKAVDGISYDVLPGEIVAVVGESGCGKTVGALSLLRLIPEPPGKIVNGEAWFDQQDLLQLDAKTMRQLRGGKISMVFQEPMSSLNPVLTVNRQLCEGLVEHQGMNWAQARQESGRLLQLVGIPDAERRLDQYPHQFSGGMRQRVMLAIALSCQPSLIIADEPTTALDVTIQAQLLELIHDLTQQFQVAVLLITHNLGVVAKYAHRVNVMYAGRIVEKGSVEEIFHHPKHPYTVALLQSVPRLDWKKSEKLVPISGQPPDLLRRPPGCAFHPRCSWVTPACLEQWPALEQIGDTHWVACDALT